MRNKVGRPEKDGKHMNLYIKKDISDRLDRYYKYGNTGHTKTKIVEEALELYLKDRMNY